MTHRLIRIYIMRLCVKKGRGNFFLGHTHDVFFCSWVRCQPVRPSFTVLCRTENERTNEKNGYGNKFFHRMCGVRIFMVLFGRIRGVTAAAAAAQAGRVRLQCARTKRA